MNIDSGNGLMLLATKHYLSQYWPRPISPYGVTRPQWVNSQTYCRVPIWKWLIPHSISLINQWQGSLISGGVAEEPRRLIFHPCNQFITDKLWWSFSLVWLYAIFGVIYLISVAHMTKALGGTMSGNFKSDGFLKMRNLIQYNNAI